MNALSQDLRYAVRTVFKARLFTAVTMATLALGIGANTAIFSVVNDTFLRPLPYPDPDRLVLLWERTTGGDHMGVAYPDFLDWREQQNAFSGLAFSYFGDSKLQIPEGAELVPTCLVSADFFAVLGVRTTEGRDPAAQDDKPGAAPVAWVTSEAREKYFPGDQSPIGRAMVLDGQTVTVAGVLPAGFRLYRRADFYLSFAPYAQQPGFSMRENHNGNAYVLGRLKPETTLDATQTQMSEIARRIELQYPKTNTGIGVRVLPLRDQLAGAARPQLLLLLGAVGMVLMIACVNVANMLLGRSFARRREMAVRTALGATRLQLARQLLVESLALAFASGLAGAALGLWGYKLVRRLVPAGVQQTVGASAGLDLRVLLFVVAVSLITGVGFGLVPAWQSSHTDPNDALRNTKHITRTLFGRFRVSDLLIVAQVALALTLLIGAGLLIRSLGELMRVPSGIRPERVLTLRVEPPPMAGFWRDPHAFSAYFERILDSVQPLPGVEAAAVATGLPFAFNDNTMPLYREGQPIPRPGEFPTASIHTVSPDYFRVMGIPLLRGRLFDGHETPFAVPPGLELAPQNFGVIFKDVVFDGVVSQRMAARYWPGQDPVGKRFRLGQPELQLAWVQIVGVVGSTTQFGLDQGETTEFYLSLRQWPVPAPMHLAVRTRMDPAAAVASIRGAARTAVRDVTVGDVQLMSERIAGSVESRQFSMGLFTSFAGTALLLSLIGIYGVLSFAVGQRTREIGIQMALGAERRDVLREVLARGLRLALPGVVLGLAGAWGVSRLLRNSLFGISGNDMVTYVGGTSLILAMAFLACLIPALRAAKVDPMVALRSE